MRGVREVSDAVERHESVTGRFGTHAVVQKPVVDEMIEPVQAEADQDGIVETESDEARGGAVGRALVVEGGIGQQQDRAFMEEVAFDLPARVPVIHGTAGGSCAAREVVGDGDV